MDVTYHNNSTPLHVSAEEVCIQVLEILLEHGASVHVTDQDGNTPLLKTYKCNKKILDYQSKQNIVCMEL
jgi:ankyrin repeat protein